MSNFDEFLKKASVTAKGAAKKTSEVYESAKLNWKIANEEERIKDIYCKLGKHYYADYDGENCEDQDLSDLCEQVGEIEVNLRALNRKLQKYKKVVRCPKCGKEFRESAVFCPVCGSRV